jgi:hypothetical protein
MAAAVIARACAGVGTSQAQPGADGTTSFDHGGGMSGLHRPIAAFALLLAATTVALAAPKAAIFPFELIDVSIEGELGGRRTDETQRLALATRELRRLATQDAGYELLELSGLEAEIERAAPLHKCGGCEVNIARRAGADLAFTGTVRKVSGLILSLSIQVRDVSNGRLTRVMQADIRGNTDESWIRGVRWLVKNRLLAEPGQQ